MIKTGDEMFRCTSYHYILINLNICHFNKISGFHLSGDVSSGFSSSSTQTVASQLTSSNETNSRVSGVGNISALSAVHDRSRFVPSNYSRPISLSGTTASNVGEDTESTVKKYKVSLSFDR